MSNVNSIKIRMYDTGSVGDCFLLIFEKDGNPSFTMMIDCGGFNTKAAAVNLCVQDILNTCGGTLDLLVLTHEHEDHISGFNLARDLFNQITVKEVWMSWVEDKNDDIAQILKTKFGKKLKELKVSATKALIEIKKLSGITRNIKGSKERVNISRQNIENTLALIEFEEGKKFHASNLSTGRRTNADAMKYIRSKGKKIDYKKPGEVVSQLPGAEGIKFFMLGPPREKDLKFMKIEEEEDEMFGIAAAVDGNDDDEQGDEPIMETGISLTNGVSPFAEEYQLKGTPKSVFLKPYNTENKWRQIETDWLEASTDLALALTDLTNNTSLAMALEFEGTDTVILLPADAQSGNWMSWQKKDVMKALKKNGGKDTNELLENAVFYKVGHHGSHNGTATHSGLNRMNNKNLVAFMPLIQAKVPKQWGGAANFPAQALYDELIVKTRGRVVRTDEGAVTDSNAKKLRSQLSSTEKKEWNNNLVNGPNFFEYTVRST